MQKTMQSKCAVFRTEKNLKEGVDDIRKTYDGMDSISVKDRSLVFNTDLVETLEFDNLIRQAVTTVESAYHRKESRGSRRAVAERCAPAWGESAIRCAPGRVRRRPRRRRRAAARRR